MFSNRLGSVFIRSHSLLFVVMGIFLDQHFPGTFDNSVQFKDWFSQSYLTIHADYFRSVLESAIFRMKGVVEHDGSVNESV